MGQSLRDSVMTIRDLIRLIRMEGPCLCSADSSRWHATYDVRFDVFKRWINSECIYAKILGNVPRDLKDLDTITNRSLLKTGNMVNGDWKF